MIQRSIGLLALGVAGVLLASAALIFPRDSVEELQQARANGVREESDSDSPQVPVLESPEPLPREGRTPASEDPPRDTRAPTDSEPSGSAGTVPTEPVVLADPVELRALPESNMAEMSHKRDAIQHLLTQLSEPILEQRFRDGNFERLTDELERRYQLAGSQHSDLMIIRQSTEYAREGNTIHLISTSDRAVLPRPEYPELYSLKDEVERLNLSIQGRALVDYHERKAEQAMEKSW